MDLEKHLAGIKGVNGFLGVGIFTDTGEFLAGTASVSGIHQELAGAALNDTLLHAQKITEDLGMGRADFIQIDAGVGKVIARCYNQGNIHFHVIVYVSPEGNIAMAKLLLGKAMPEIAAEF